jgi:hypothetical protein
MSKISVVVELYSDTSIYVAGVINDMPGQEVLGSMGTAGREDVTRVVGRWDLATIQAAFSKNRLLAETSDVFKKRFNDHLVAESQKHSILLKP